MSFQKQINKLSSNDVKLPKKYSYSVILGLNPSQGARSPSLWNSAYSEFGIDAEMIPIDVTPANFSNLMSVLNLDLSFVGGAIAAPHKESAARHVRLTSEAKSIGAINCLFRNTDGELCGTNTDGEGSLKSFINTYGNIKDKKILILGIGGTGKAVATYFSSYVTNLTQILLSSRSFAAKEYAKILGCESIQWDSVKSILPEIDIVINCTNLGSTLNPGLSPLDSNDIELLEPHSIIYDIVYDPNPTPLTELALKKDIAIFNGLDMNFEQAVLGFHYSASMGKNNMEIATIREAMKKF